MTTMPSRNSAAEPSGTVHLDERNGSWGRPTPVDAGAIQRVRLVSPSGTTVAVAAFT
jgi:hypothetical protein